MFQRLNLGANTYKQLSNSLLISAGTADAAILPTDRSIVAIKDAKYLKK